MTTAPDDDRLKIYVNTNITMSRGKMAAHAAHAALTAAGVHPDVPIVVLGAKPRDIEQMSTVIHDHGKTELEPGTLTAGTDYVFESQKHRRQAVSELMQIAAVSTDPFIAARVAAALDLLGADTAPPAGTAHDTGMTHPPRYSNGDAGGYRVEQNELGTLFRWSWHEPGEPVQYGEWVSTRSEAFTAAATDWDECGSGGRLAATLRAAATRSRKKEASC